MMSSSGRGGKRRRITMMDLPSVPSARSPLFRINRTRSITGFEGMSDRYFAFMLYLAARHPNDCLPFDVAALYDKFKGPETRSWWSGDEERDERLTELTLILETSSCKWYNAAHLQVFLQKIRECTAARKRFVVLPLVIQSTTEDRDDHGNMLIADTTLRTLERFEPHGWEDVHTRNIHTAMNVARNDIRGDASLTEEEKHAAIFLVDLRAASLLECDVDKFLKERLLQDRRSPLYGYTYIPPKQFCPEAGPQWQQELSDAGNVIGKKVGFCAAWGFWYADLRLRYPDVQPKQLIDRALTEMKADRGKTLTQYIVAYSSFFESLQPFLHNPKHLRQIIEELA